MQKAKSDARQDRQIGFTAPDWEDLNKSQKQPTLLAEHAFIGLEHRQ